MERYEYEFLPSLARMFLDAVESFGESPGGGGGGGPGVCDDGCCGFEGWAWRFFRPIYDKRPPIEAGEITPYCFCSAMHLKRNVVLEAGKMSLILVSFTAE